MTTFRTTIIVFLLCLSHALGAGKITTVAQVASIQEEKAYVLILIDGIEGAKLDPRQTVYHKVGAPASAANYQSVGTMLQTKNVNTITAQFALAAQAGFDNAALESTLDEMLGGKGGTGSLTDKFLKAISAELPNGLDEMRLQMLLRTYPQTALPLGQGLIAVVPSGTNTFEVRNAGGDSAIGRATVNGGPMVLPAVGQMGERVDATPTGDLTVSLRWCTPDPLRLRSLHVGGYHLYRVSVNNWAAEVGGNVPLNMTRPLLLSGIANGVIDQVNRTPVGPEIDLDCPLDPTQENFFFIDANDTKDLQRNEIGGTPFLNGEQVVYFAAAFSHVGVVGNPSLGLPVTVCDRIPPSPPRDLRVANLHAFENGVAKDFLELSWQAQPEDETEFYCVHRYRDADGALKDRAAANWPANNNLVAIVENVNPDEFGRIHFADDGTADLPAALPHPTIAANANQTFWYTVCSIDRSACKDLDGYGNIGAPTGAAPAALYRSDGPGRAGGRVRVPCCGLEVNPPVPGATQNGSNVVLTGQRNSNRIIGVEFAAESIIQGEMVFLDALPFPAGAEKQVSTEVDLAEFVTADLRLMARFHTDAGRTSEWVSSELFSSARATPDHRWDAKWTCKRAQPVSNCNGIIDPVDPETGEYLDICVDIDPPPARAVELAIYTRIEGGAMIRRYRNEYTAPFEFCFSAPASPGRVCIFTQTFDKDGNPGVVFPLKCVETTGHEGFPMPTITQANYFPVELGESNGLSTLGWSSPTAGVYRFEIRVTPPIPGETKIMNEELEAGVITRSWSHHDTPSLPSGFGNGNSDFAWPLSLAIGETHTVYVRAVGSGDDATRNVGAWSDPKELTWSPDSSNGSPPQDGVSWPIRPVPGDADTELLSLFSPDDKEVGPDDRYIWIEVGEMERERVIQESVFDTGTGAVIPAVVDVESLEPYLFVELPFVGYIQRVDIDAKPNIQATHFIDTVLMQSAGGGNFSVIDQSFHISRKKSKSTISIWLRLVQPIAKGATYRGTILQHHADRESRALFRANPVQIQ
ncbi:MAG: hypothetical protein ACI9R3_002659 [Verrucomicrobiales bacterium]|jgi:hypothetical protein